MTMKPDECRARARQCRDHARGAELDIRDSFLNAAEVWDQLAEQLERIEQGALLFAGQRAIPRHA
jgi:hypothetical protein